MYTADYVRLRRMQSSSTSYSTVAYFVTVKTSQGSRNPYTVPSHFVSCNNVTRQGPAFKLRVIGYKSEWNKLIITPTFTRPVGLLQNRNCNYSHILVSIVTTMDSLRGSCLLFVFWSLTILTSYSSLFIDEVSMLWRHSPGACQTERPEVFYACAKVKVSALSAPFVVGHCWLPISAHSLTLTLNRTFLFVAYVFLYLVLNFILVDCCLITCSCCSCENFK